MTFLDGTQRFEARLVANLRTAFEEKRRQYKQHQRFLATRNELFALNDHELADLGIARSEIPTIAKQAVADT